MAIEISGDEIKYDAFVKRGSLQYRRDCLSPEDPDHLYNYLKSNGVTPEDWGIFHPIIHELEEKYMGYSRKSLIAEIAKLTTEMRNMERNFEQWR